MKLFKASEKGLSPVISAVLLVMIAISLTLVAFLYVQSLQEKALARGSSQAEDAQRTDDIEIQSVRLNSDKNEIIALFVRNKSAHDIGGITIFIGGTRVNCTSGQDEILENDVKVFTPTICTGIDAVDVSDASTEITVSSNNGTKTVTLNKLVS